MLTLLTLFIIKHFVCDFILQDQRMLTEKGTYLAAGGIYHALVHALGTLLILVCMIPQHQYLALFCAGFDGIVHYYIDFAKSQLSKGISQTDPKFWYLLGADQALHYLTYVIILALAL